MNRVWCSPNEIRIAVVLDQKVDHFACFGPDAIKETGIFITDNPQPILMFAFDSDRKTDMEVLLRSGRIEAVCLFQLDEKLMF